MSKEKTYLKWYNKVGYGSGDVAGNVVYALLTSFVMIYLTDTIGLNAGVIGVLIAVSKIFDVPPSGLGISTRLTGCGLYFLVRAEMGAASTVGPAVQPSL